MERELCIYRGLQPSRQFSFLQPQTSLLPNKAEGAPNKAEGAMG